MQDEAEFVTLEQEIYLPILCVSYHACGKFPEQINICCIGAEGVQTLPKEGLVLNTGGCLILRLWHQCFKCTGRRRRKPATIRESVCISASVQCLQF